VFWFSVKMTGNVSPKGRRFRPSDCVPCEYVGRRGWTIALQVKEVGRGAAQRQFRGAGEKGTVQP